MGTLVAVIAGYVAGSIPTGYWLVGAIKRTDIRRHGSGNIGGTNAWRVFGWRLGLPVVLVDTLKGFVPALLGALLVGKGTGVLAGGAAMLGHWRPLFLRWQRGGKMVATCGGAFLGVAPLVGGIGAGVWIATFLLLRYASVASMVAALSLPVTAVLVGEPWPVVAFAGVAAVAVVALHRGNIARLRAGTENRFRFRRASRAKGGPAPEPK